MARRMVLVAAGVAALAVGAAAFTAVRAGDEPRKDVRKIVIFRSGGSWLGVQIADVDAARAKEIGLREELGAEVQSVSPGSPAEEAGLKKGDVILEYQGARIEGVMQLTRLVQETPAGRTAALKVFRDGATRTVQVKVGERDGDDEGDTAKRYEVLRGHSRAHEFHIPETPEPPDVDLDDIDIPGLMELTGHMGRPRLGANVDTLGKQLAEYFGVKQGSGVLVTSVMKGGAGESAGLKAGDVIVKVDEESIDDVSDLHMALREKHDKEVRLTVVRDRREQTLAVPPLPESKSSDHPKGPHGMPAVDQHAIREQIRQAMREADRVQVDRAAIERQVEEALRQAREAARAAEELGRETQEPVPGGGAVDIRSVPEQEREDIRRAVEEGRRIRIEMQQGAGD